MFNFANLYICMFTELQLAAEWGGANKARYNKVTVKLKGRQSKDTPIIGNRKHTACLLACFDINY
jgi:hypothetical protein